MIEDVRNGKNINLNCDIDNGMLNIVEFQDKKPGIFFNVSYKLFLYSNAEQNPDYHVYCERLEDEIYASLNINGKMQLRDDVILEHIENFKIRGK